MPLNKSSHIKIEIDVCLIMIVMNFIVLTSVLQSTLCYHSFQLASLNSLIVVRTIFAGKFLANGEDAKEFLKKEENYPVSLKFGKSKLTTNERIMLASMFHSMFAIACKLSPVENSSGIETIEAESFKLHCHQTPTGTKFLVLTEPRQQNMDTLLRRIYKLYADFAMKNPFYSLEMPIRCELFDLSIQNLLEDSKRLE